MDYQDYSPLDQLAEKAAQKMLRDGMDNISDKEFQLIMAHWMNARADAGRKDMISAIENTNGANGSKLDAVKKHGPVASGGVGIGVVIAYMRDLLGG